MIEPKPHQWKGGMIRTDYGTGVEYVRYCEACGYEDPGEDEMPDCSVLLAQDGK